MVCGVCCVLLLVVVPVLILLLGLWHWLRLWLWLCWQLFLLLLLLWPDFIVVAKQRPLSKAVTCKPLQGALYDLSEASLCLNRSLLSHPNIFIPSSL